MIKRIPGTQHFNNKNNPPEETIVPKEEEKQIVIINNIQAAGPDASDLRNINLYGDINEQRATDTISGLLYLENTAITTVPENPNNLNSQMILASRSISLYISTHGGAAADMFSILDVMDMVSERTCDIETYGIGKVMSAGVPILAAGTKGKRKVGKNCRIMLHNVIAGSHGTIFKIENELEEIRWIQEKYIECLASYTKMTEARIKKMLKTQADVYISAEEAIKLGIADEII